MRFVLAIICFVLALGTMGTGIAERTFLAGPDEVTLTSTAHQQAPVVVIDGAALNAYPETQEVKLSGSSDAFAAYGRTSDVLAWVGNTNYTEVSINKTTGKLQSKLHHGAANTVPDPSGSDLWLQQYPSYQAKDFQAKVPTNMSVIAVSNGKRPAPSTVSVTWPLDNSTPWSGPLILVGVIALILGLIFLLWAFNHLRRTRGPRRTPQRMPKLPKQPRFKTQPKTISGSPAKGRRAIRNFVAVVPVVGISALLLAGCTATPAPTIVNSASAAPKAAGGASAQQPVVSRVQLQKIVTRISDTVKSADATLDVKKIKTRMAGAALENRLADYIIHKQHPTVQPSIDIPSELGNYNLPEKKNGWPRSIFTVVKSGSKTNQEFIALVLTQHSPRSNYKVNYAMALQPNTALPKVAPVSVGASLLDPNIGLLKLQPSAIALAYGDILDNDTAAANYNLFQAKGDAFRQQVGMAAKQAAAKTLPATAKLTYTNQNGDGQVIALQTIDSGALVAVDLNEIETVKPVQAGAAVSVEGAIEAFLNKGTSTKGIAATYGDQLLFYVPASGPTSGKIVLLGYSQGLINAEEL